MSNTIASDQLNAIGTVDFTVTGADGEVKQHFTTKNLVVAVGKAWIATRMLNATNAVMSHMAVGTGTTAPSAGNIALSQQIARVAFSTTAVNQTQITYTAVFPAGVATGAITEAGIFNQATSGTMLCRTTFNQVNKDVLDTLTINWTVTIV